MLKLFIRIMSPIAEKQNLIQLSQRRQPDAIS